MRSGGVIQVKADNGKKKNGTIDKKLCSNYALRCTFFFFFFKENLPVFPAAVRLASGLYTELCSGHRGHVHCLDACRERRAETGYTPQKKSIKCVTANRMSIILTTINIVGDNNYSINFTTVLFL